MGKGGGSTPKSTTQTVTSKPYLAGDVNFAAQEAKNLYQGYTPEMTALTNQITSINEQIANAQKTASAGMPAFYGTNAETIKANIAKAKAAQGSVNTQPLIDQRAALEKQLAGLDPDLPQYFPGQTYVNYSPETEAALQMMTNRATDGSPLMAGANKTLTDTVNGTYLNNNPYIDSVINNSLNDVTRKYSENILPGLASNFASSGRYGSGIQQNMTADAVGQLGKEAMGVASGLRYDNYNNERTRQLQATAMAPTLAQSDYYDAQQLLGVGGAREALSQAKLQDEMDRYNFNENLSSNMLDQYINRIGTLGSGYGTQTTNATSQVSKPSALGSILGAGITGLGLASGLGAFGSAGLLGGLFGASTPAYVTAGLPLALNGASRMGGF